ncbi:hypothetical protein AAHA92_04389 [Salvia divinorum]|uniref:Uncharacterized protein n=1 Tax=Salvia divinorum TaxID=28513 RepID=A0ABD1HZ23_SALDI
MQLEWDVPGTNMVLHDGDEEQKTHIYAVQYFTQMDYCCDLVRFHHSKKENCSEVFPCRSPTSSAEDLIFFHDLKGSAGIWDF